MSDKPHVLSKEYVDQRIAERKAGHPGPLSYACYGTSHDDCGLWGCQCRCHYVTAAHLRKLIREGR